MINHHIDIAKSWTDPETRKWMTGVWAANCCNVFELIIANPKDPKLDEVVTRWALIPEILWTRVAQILYPEPIDVKMKGGDGKPTRSLREEHEWRKTLTDEDRARLRRDFEKELDKRGWLPTYKALEKQRKDRERVVEMLKAAGKDS